MNEKRYHVFRWWLHIENAEGVAACYVGTYSTIEEAQSHFLDDIKLNPRDYHGEIMMDNGITLTLAAWTGGLDGLREKHQWLYAAAEPDGRTK